MRTFDGLELDVRTYGPEDVPVTVVLSHCWTLNQEDWHYQVRDLQREFGHAIRIVTWDHRGHGRSQEAPRRDCTIDNLARDMSDVIDAHAPRNAPFYWHDTNQSQLNMDVREGRLRPDIRNTGLEEPGVKSSDLGIVILEKHFSKYEYWFWDFYGTTTPSQVLTHEDVPTVVLYERPKK